MCVLRRAILRIGEILGFHEVLQIQQKLSCGPQTPANSLQVQDGRRFQNTRGNFTISCTSMACLRPYANKIQRQESPPVNAFEVKIRPELYRNRLYSFPQYDFFILLHTYIPLKSRSSIDGANKQNLQCKNSEKCDHS